nr:SAP30 binding protein [Hymenolepis microstoma]
MSDDNSPNIVTSEDESVTSTNAPKRKLDEGVDQELKLAEPQPKISKRLPSGSGINLVSYDFDHDDDDSQSDSSSSAETSDETTKEPYLSVNVTNLPFMNTDGGPVTVLSSEHIVAAHDSPAVLTDGGASATESTAEKDNSSSDGASPLREETENDKGDDDVILPPEPSEMCSLELQNKVETAIRRMQHDISFDPNRMIQDNKSFRNPSIYKKLISFLGIDEKGSNFSKEVYDPYRWDANSYYDKLAEIQNREVERQDKLQKERRKAEATNAVPGSTTASGASAGLHRTASGTEVRKKSKWDTAGPVDSSQLPPPKIADPLSGSAVGGTAKVTIPAIGDLFHKK